MSSYIIFPIGDWSCDGHNCYADYLVKSEKSLTEVRETHLKENHFIGNLCSDYENNKIQVDELYDFLKQYTNDDNAKKIIQKFVDDGMEIIDEEEADNLELIFELEDPDNPQYLVVYSPEEMLKVWITILNTINPELKLEVASEAMSSYYIKYKGYPHEPEGDISFYGFDEEKRHIDTPGYGVWKDYEGEFYHPG